VASCSYKIQVQDAYIKDQMGQFAAHQGRLVVQTPTGIGRFMRRMENPRK
jgi:hypothetical protein